MLALNVQATQKPDCERISELLTSALPTRPMAISPISPYVVTWRPCCLSLYLHCTTSSIAYVLMVATATSVASPSYWSSLHSNARQQSLAGDYALTHPSDSFS